MLGSPDTQDSPVRLHLKSQSVVDGSKTDIMDTGDASEEDIEMEEGETVKTEPEVRAEAEEFQDKEYYATVKALEEIEDGEAVDCKEPEPEVLQ